MKIWHGMLLAAVSIAASPVQYFAYERPILNTSAISTQACLALDAGIFAQAAPQLADLRLYHGNVETPFIMQVAAPVDAEEKSITPLNLGSHGKDTVFDADMPAGTYSDVELSISAKDFIATVRVSGIHPTAETPGGVETTLGLYTVFDLTQQKLGRSTVLHLPESDFEHLHFVVSGPIQPENITGLSVVRIPVSQPQYQGVAQSTQVTQKDHHSVITFTVPARVPLDRVVFVPTAEPENFSRDVSVTVTPLKPATTDEELPPQRVTLTGNLLRVHRSENGHRIDEEHLAVDMQSVAFDAPAKWVISIDNGDDTPLSPASVNLQMLQRKLCFQAAAGASYTLLYGDEMLASPHYDYAALFTQQADAQQVAMGPEKSNPDYRPRPDPRPFTEKHPALLWAALILVIALLAIIALRPVLLKKRSA